jgi:hypothetical protein
MVRSTLARLREKVAMESGVARAEHDLLAQWAAAREESPVVPGRRLQLALPDVQHALRGLQRNAHFAAGSGLQPQFPEALPDHRIDQVLGNAHVAFEDVPIDRRGLQRPPRAVLQILASRVEVKRGGRRRVYNVDCALEASLESAAS